MDPRLPDQHFCLAIPIQVRSDRVIRVWQDPAPFFDSASPDDMLDQVQQYEQ